jgi:hypothetical protein
VHVVWLVIIILLLHSVVNELVQRGVRDFVCVSAVALSAYN